MTILIRLHASRLAHGAWIAVALTPYGRMLGIANFAFLSGEGEAKGMGQVTGIQVALLLVAAPATAVVLAIRTARARYRSGRIAVVVSRLLLLATLVLTLLPGRIGLVVLAVVAVLVFVGTRCGGLDEEVAPRVGDRFRAVTRYHGPCRVGNRGENDGDGLRIVTRAGGEFRHQTDPGSR